MDFTADQCCFVCGTDNPLGFHLTFSLDGDEYVTTAVIDPAYQGYRGIVHGGIIATILDEVMARYVWERAQGPAATAKLEVRYRRPAPVGVPIQFRGRIDAVKREGAVFETSAAAYLPDGVLLAEATGIVMRVAPSSSGR